MVAVVCGVAVLLLLPLAASEDDPLLIPEERVLVSSAVLLLPALSSRAASDSACSPAVGGQRPVDRDHRPESNVILARKLRLVKAFQGKCKSGKVVICVLTLRLHVYTQQDTCMLNTSARTCRGMQVTPCGPTAGCERRWELRVWDCNSL